MTAFNLPQRLKAKAEPALINADDAHFAAIEHTLQTAIADLRGRLDAERKAPAGYAQAALERDLSIHRMSARLKALSRYGLDLCLGHTVSADGETVYVGRFGLTDDNGRHLLVDWRSPVAEPFFGATHANPMGLTSRRRYRWTQGHITDYWDEVFTADGLEHNAALDDQSAFIASLGSSRSPQMRDVLGTIAADQDEIIRAGSRGALVVDGGPGTGKTVVALHRTAYLLYSDPRLGHHTGGVLFVGPHPAYLAYVADVLPSLGEEGVQTCTIRGLVAEGAGARDEANKAVAALKSTARVGELIENAVRIYERPPSTDLLVETEWGDLEFDADDWAEAFDAAEPGATHNEAREQVWDQLRQIILDQLGDDIPDELLTDSLRQNAPLRSAFNRSWPLLEAATLVAALWSKPAYLRAAAPWLSAAEVELLQRRDPREWTTSDLPFLDLARQRLGDPEEAKRDQQRKAAVAEQQEEMARVVELLIESDDSEMQLMSMLRREDAKNSLIDESGFASVDPDLLAGPFAHIVVDEAQELTDAEWQLLLQRCPSRSFTIVGDRAQARHGFTESWDERLERVGFRDVSIASLSINYRTPSEIMDEAEPIIRAALPDANVPTSIRSTGVPVLHGSAVELDGILESWLAEHDEGTACVIGDHAFEARRRVQSLPPEQSKGLEFDLVILVDPETFGDGIEGAVDRYVAMTRATQQLVVLAGVSPSEGDTLGGYAREAD